MAALAVDPKIERQIAPLLSKGEQLLWAARRRGLGRRQWRRFWIMLLFVGLWFALVTSIFGPYAAAFMFGSVLLLGLPSHVWRIVGQWFYVFALTDHRLIIMRKFYPSNWWSIYLTDLNPHWIRFGTGKNVIHLDGAQKTKGAWNWLQLAHTTWFIENVPDIEAVRALILARIATAKPLPPEKKVRQPDPVHGTRSG